MATTKPSKIAQVIAGIFMLVFIAGVALIAFVIHGVASVPESAFAKKVDLQQC